VWLWRSNSVKIANYLTLILPGSTVGQGYNKYINRFKLLSIHKIAMHYGGTRYQRMILHHQNVSESLQTHQNASAALKLVNWNLLWSEIEVMFE